MAAEAPRTIDLAQTRIAYRDSGAGDPLLFIHGWPLSSLTWRKVIPALEPSYRCIAIDLMGAGDTEADLSSDFSIPAQAGMLAAFLDALKLPSVTVIAHNSGALIGRQLAVDQPGRASRMVIFDTEVPGHVARMVSFLQMTARLPGSQRMFRALLGSRRFLHSPLGFGNAAHDRGAMDFDEFLATTTGPILRSPETLRGTLKFLLDFDLHFIDSLPHTRLTMPKLVLWGSHDAFFRYAWGQELLEMLPEPKSFTTIVDCGIFPHEERPADWLAAVQPFLAATPA